MDKNDLFFVDSLESLGDSRFGFGECSISFMLDIEDDEAMFW
jgi:hypothetical protein